MWESILRHGLVVFYVTVLAAVALYGFHRYILVYLYLKHRHDGYQPKDRYAPGEMPPDDEVATPSVEDALTPQPANPAA